MTSAGAAGLTSGAVPAVTAEAVANQAEPYEEWEGETKRKSQNEKSYCSSMQPRMHCQPRTFAKRERLMLEAVPSITDL
jgi:hypothetical protein